jgi:hypothetical protein
VFGVILIEMEIEGDGEEKEGGEGGEENDLSGL